VRVRFVEEEHWIALEVYKPVKAGEELILNGNSYDCKQQYDTYSEFTSSSGGIRDPQPGVLTVMSWNPNGLRTVAARIALLRIIRQECPSIVCLQEIKTCAFQGGNHKEPIFQALEALGYLYNIWNSNADSPTDHGTALCSQYKFTRGSTAMSLEDFQDQGRFIAVEFNQLILMTAYVPSTGPNGLNMDRRHRWARCFTTDIADFIESANDLSPDTPRQPWALTMDANVAPRPEDFSLSHEPMAANWPSFTKEERKLHIDRLQRLAAEDIWPVMNPEVKGVDGHTWQGQSLDGRGISLRLDMTIVGSDALHGPTQGAQVKAIYKVQPEVHRHASDHTPIITVFGNWQPDKESQRHWLWHPQATPCQPWHPTPQLTTLPSQKEQLWKESKDEWRVYRLRQLESRISLRARATRPHTDMEPTSGESKQAHFMLLCEDQDRDFTNHLKATINNLAAMASVQNGPLHYWAKVLLEVQDSCWWAPLEVGKQLPKGQGLREFTAEDVTRAVAKTLHLATAALTAKRELAQQCMIAALFLERAAEEDQASESTRNFYAGIAQAARAHGFWWDYWRSSVRKLTKAVSGHLERQKRASRLAPTTASPQLQREVVKFASLRQDNQLDTLEITVKLDPRHPLVGTWWELSATGSVPTNDQGNDGRGEATFLVAKGPLIRGWTANPPEGGESVRQQDHESASEGDGTEGLLPPEALWELLRT
jgi:exodeoxyribonuclease-3